MKPVFWISFFLLTLSACMTTQGQDKRKPLFSDLSSGQAEILSKKFLVQKGETYSFNLNESKILDGEKVNSQQWYDYWFVVFPNKDAARDVEYLIVIKKENGKIKFAGPRLQGEDYGEVLGDNIY